MINAIESGDYLVEHRDGIVSIKWNRPEFRNAIPTSAVRPLADLFEQIATDADVLVILVTAAGDNFGGGGDLAGMMASLEMEREARSASYFQRLDYASRMVRNWCAIPQPIVTACRGSVAGAAMMYTLGADIVIGDPSTFFMCAHTYIGLSPDSGLSWLLPRVVGVKRAAEMFMSGRKVKAEEALAMGLLSRVVMAEQLDEVAGELARSLAAGPVQVLRDAKRMIADAPEVKLDSQLDLERDRVAYHVAAPDFEEGVRAFMEKRRPHFPSASSLSG